MRVALLALSLAVAGCGSGTGLVPVSGKVTLDGQPVKEGSVAFISSSKTVKGAGALVLKGAYALSDTNGLAPGKYRVEIHIPIPTGKTRVDPESHETIPETKEGAPPPFNSESTLTADVTTGNRVFNFDVKSK